MRIESVKLDIDPKFESINIHNIKQRLSRTQQLHLDVSKFDSSHVQKLISDLQLNGFKTAKVFGTLMITK